MKNIKKIALLISIVLMSTALALSVGFTAAIWTDKGGSSQYTADANSTDWNVWSKYFVCENVFDTAQNVIGVAIIGFSGVDITEMIIPSELEGVAINCNAVGKKPVLTIRNTLFSNTTLKQMPKTIKISPSVISIEARTFAALPNLISVVFGGYEAVDVTTCSVGDMAFLGCSQLASVSKQGVRNINYGVNVFGGTKVVV